MAKETTYVSDTDKFITNLLQERPDLIKKQKALRATWWDRGFIDPIEQKELAQAQASKPGYVYFDYENEITVKDAEVAPLSKKAE